MTKKRILFVDDDAAILRFLSRMLLRSDGSRWDMHFVLGGEAGLHALTQGSFDMLVTDLDMPGVDGASLLTAAKRIHPAAARIVLSASNRDHADADASLPKPCRPDDLRSLLARFLDSSPLPERSQQVPL